MVRLVRTTSKCTPRAPRMQRSQQKKTVPRVRSWWTTCEDSITQTAELLAELERTLCFDPRRVYATGVSNGGVFLYELAASRLASSFAAYMPIVGSPHRGFNVPPQRPAAPFFGIWGRVDDTIPPVANTQVRGHPGDPDVAIDTRYGGYFYTTAEAVVRTWAVHNGCEHAATQPPTPAGCAGSGACEVATNGGAECVGFSSGCADGASVLKCIHPDGHAVPRWAAEAVFAFMGEQPASLPALPPSTSRLATLQTYEIGAVLAAALGLIIFLGVCLLPRVRDRCAGSSTSSVSRARPAAHARGRATPPRAFAEVVVASQGQEMGVLPPGSVS